MPTRLPEPRTELCEPAAPVLSTLASAWLAGLIVLAAAAGSADGHGRCAAPTIAGAAAPAPTRDDGPGGAVRDMLAHD